MIQALGQPEKTSKGTNTCCSFFQTASGEEKGLILSSNAWPSDPAVQSTLRWSGLEVAGSNLAGSREKLAEIKIPPLMHDDFQFLELLVVF
jgi:hypothetical protein